MNLILIDDEKKWLNLLPLTYTRPVSEIRIGILTIREKWEKHLKTKASYGCKNYLRLKFPTVFKKNTNNYFINSNVIPDAKLVAAIKKLKPKEGLNKDNVFIAFCSDNSEITSSEVINNCKEYNENIFSINNVWDIFQKNGEALKADFDLLTKGKKSQALSKSNTVVGNKKLIFIEKGAKIEASTFNTSGGPIYIGKNAEVMEGALIRGPFSLGEESVLKLGAKVYGPTTIGVHCKVGGEVSNSVIFGYSNKAHDGFIGNTVIGEWCNLGADTNTSNLKNNYGSIKLFNYESNGSKDTGLQFCGLIMGDHCKCGINTMFNTGTVAGVGANIFGGGFPPTHIPSFVWGGAEGFDTYRLEKMFETTQRVYARRNMTLESVEKKILEIIFSETTKFREWE
ncbi:MAG TPA: GlmU family protein [Bacteroidia bacterium]|jgi:UDP-N-acetylglucosamine diphosphorylase/glucosamine-1-phosphate N-acetyltransferase|nr:GlmU family protein [Bacteroidia bacterium]